MAMWVCRAGKDSIYYDLFKEKSSIFLAWEGFDVDLNSLDTKEDLRAYVINEKSTDNRTSVSNWLGQLMSFSREMACGEYVLIPSKGSHYYSLVKIVGGYEYRKHDDVELYHSRDVQLLCDDIPRQVFEQDIIYSLGAYRTLFKVKHEHRVMEAIKKYRAGIVKGSYRC